MSHQPRVVSVTNLASLRVTRGFRTQIALAATMLGVAESRQLPMSGLATVSFHILRWETGRSHPSRLYVSLLCEVLACWPKDLSEPMLDLR